jgi:hypothetical protein
MVDYWTPATGTFSSTCPSGGDAGLQQVGLTLATTAGRVSESLVVDLRSQP